MSMHEYRLNVKGIFGRNRSVKFDSFLILDTDQDLSLDEVEKLAAAKIKEVKVKSGYCAVVRNPVEIDGIFRTVTIDFNRGTVIGYREFGAYQ
jgi:hypothetical protein